MPIECWISCCKKSKASRNDLSKGGERHYFCVILRTKDPQSQLFKLSCLFPKTFVPPSTTLHLLHHLFPLSQNQTLKNVHQTSQVRPRMHHPNKKLCQCESVPIRKKFCPNLTNFLQRFPFKPVRALYFIVNYQLLFESLQQSIHCIQK